MEELAEADVDGVRRIRDDVEGGRRLSTSSLPETAAT